MELSDVTGKIIGCCIEIHRELGPGLLESAYEECLAYELKRAGLFFERQKPVPVHYKEVYLEYGYRMDFVVENTVVVELKSVETLNPIHEAQILTYMKFAEKKIGLLINFYVLILKNGLKRFVK
ncbi:GxxExxY protein [Dyadobacter sp. Leaf189]|uniref:GxxExxY protein n=1 Tax=Dyadobacter sp. Leaf189 TaxID=1736295 RepID=UPI000700757E|nr:GxxExxY protein [Dyadobacter sp. Leaf189]KQS25437.1 GxxExxY protein [Dyadobacter sp. Leaf189]